MKDHPKQFPVQGCMINFGIFPDSVIAYIYFTKNGCAGHCKVKADGICVILPFEELFIDFQ